MTYLVTGANGAVGRLVVEGLVAQGHRVHTLTRQPLTRTSDGVRSFLGDLSATAFDEALFEGVSKVFLFPAEGGFEGFLGAAKAHGVEGVVLLSSLAAAQRFPRDQRSPSALHHLALERSVVASGLGHTFLRPGTFANNLRQWAPTIRAQGMVFGPYPESSQAPVHEADIAEVAVAALTQSGHEGSVYPLTGPQALTQVEQLAVLGRALGRDLRFQKISPEQFRQSMGRFVPDAIVTMLLDYWSDTVATPDEVSPGFEEVTGHPGRPLEAWAADHVADFVGP